MMDGSDIDSENTQSFALKSNIAPPIGLPPPPSASQPTGAQPRRFPKLWSKAIMDVFHSVNSFELSQLDLLSKFKVLHSSACSVYFGEVNQNLEEELWSNLKRFVTKAPFEFDEENALIRFDPAAIKPRAPPTKKPRLDEGDENGAIGVIGSGGTSTPLLQPAPTIGAEDLADEVIE